MPEQYFLILIILLLINFSAFFAVGSDKRKSVYGELRTPEVYFFVWSVFFGTLGILAGMFAFHHKTRKPYFTLGLSFLLLQQIALVSLVYFAYAHT